MQLCCSRDSGMAEALLDLLHLFWVQVYVDAVSVRFAGSLWRVSGGGVPSEGPWALPPPAAETDEEQIPCGSSSSIS